MKMVVSVMALLLASAAPPARPALPVCQTYTRSSDIVPELVRDWLARSADDHVRVCQAAAEGTERGAAAEAPSLYSGESALTKEGAVCSYATHDLALTGTGKKRQLRRYEHGDRRAMALAGRECPPPHAPAGAESYTVTYDVTPAAFASIMELWSAAAGSVATWDRETCCGKRERESSAPATAAAAATRARLRAAIESGRLKNATVKRIVQMTSNFALRRRYALFVADPDSRPPGLRLYVIYLGRPLGGSWQITGVADALD
jgi:hypothetical protein